MTPRCKKPRFCTCPFRGDADRIFKPAGTPLQSLVRTRLELDEIESMHLCDSLGLTQEEAGKRMGISRGTVQRILASARKKLIDAIVRGEALVIGHGPHNHEQA
jgi:predicted DNA-binding protein (UPF0251 family)